MRPPEPMGSLTARRLHPSSILFLALSRVRAFLIPLVIALFAAAGGQQFLPAILAVSFVVTIAVDLTRLFTLRYFIAENQLVVRQGLLFRRERRIPLHRIQNIDLLQNPLHRWLGVAEARLETAGGAEPEAVLRVLSLDEVERLKTTVQQPAAHAVLPPGEAAADPITDVPEASTILTISTRELVLLGLISNRGMVMLAVLLGGIYELNVLERFDWKRAQQFAQGWRPANPLLAGLAVLGLFLVAGLLLRILSVLWYLLRFHGYRLTVLENRLRVEAGLFTRVAATIPRPRIQLISIHRPTLARWSGRASVRIETAGGAGESSEGADATLARQWFIPIIRQRDVSRVVGMLRPGLDWREDEIVWQSTHPRAARRQMKKSLFLAIAAGLAGALIGWPYGWIVGPLVLPGLVWYARQSVHRRGYTHIPQGLAYRSGVFRQKTSLTFFDRIQAVSLTQTPFDRRWNMARLTVDTAGAGSAGHRVEAPLLDAGFARQEADEVYQRMRGTCLATG